MVFFDDAEVLYVNRRQHPAIAERYELKEANPFVLAGRQATEMTDKELEPVIRYLPRLLALYPDGAFTNRIAAFLHLRDGAYDRALPYAESIIRNFPESELGHRLKGDALVGLGRPDHAAACYGKALKRVPLPLRADLWKRLSTAYQAGHRYGRAYRALKKTVDIFSPETTIDDLYALGSLAALARRKTDAALLLKYIYDSKLSPADTVWAERLQHDLTRLGK